MKDKITAQRKLIHRIMSYLAIVLFIISLSLAVYGYILEKNALNISGIITSVDYQNGNIMANVKYTVAGKIYENKISLKDDTEASVNDPANIKVDMRNPQKQINNIHLLLAALSFIFACFLSVFFLPTYIKERKQERKADLLMKTGLYIQAPLTEIYANNKGKQYKKRYPSRLRCHYVNPQDSKQYIFDSEDTFLNLAEIIKQYNSQTVTVYIDKTNTNNYYVDLSSLAPKLNIVDPIAFMKSQNKKAQVEETKEVKTENASEEKAEDKGTSTE